MRSTFTGSIVFVLVYITLACFRYLCDMSFVSEHDEIDRCLRVWRHLPQVDELEAMTGSMVGWEGMGPHLD